MDERRRLVHDLRTPLSVVEIFSALLEQDGGQLTDEQRREYAERIRRASAEMRALLDG
jgi:signal transduction histidine kinase